MLPTPWLAQLDVLACNLFGGGVVSGEVLVNGAPRRASEFSKISSYVLQRGARRCVCRAAARVAGWLGRMAEHAPAALCSVLSAGSIPWHHPP
jgi:hypothetical protein